MPSADRSLPEPSTVILASENPSAGNGVFGCRDRRPKITQVTAKLYSDRTVVMGAGKIPTATAYSDLALGFAVCPDWMVGATGIEPVTPTMSTWCSPAELRARSQ